MTRTITLVDTDQNTFMGTALITDPGDERLPLAVVKNGVVFLSAKDFGTSAKGNGDVYLKIDTVEI